MGGGEEQRQPAQRIDPRRWRGASEEISQSICYTAEEVAPAARPVGIECGRELRSCGKVLKIHLAVFLSDAALTRKWRRRGRRTPYTSRRTGSGY